MVYKGRCVWGRNQLRKRVCALQRFSPPSVRLANRPSADITVFEQQQEYGRRRAARSHLWEAKVAKSPMPPRSLPLRIRGNQGKSGTARFKEPERAITRSEDTRDDFKTVRRGRSAPCRGKIIGLSLSVAALGLSFRSFLGAKAVWRDVGPFSINSQS